MLPGVPVAAVAIDGAQNAAHPERARYGRSADDALAKLTA
jgi:phosphoribosylcarboxyaminoimidazole (NCAIR) mutase